MEFFGGENNFTYEKLIGFENGVYKQVGVMFESEKKTTEESCGPGVTFKHAIFSIVDQLAALHYYHWCDKSNFEKYPYLRYSQYMQGKD